MVQGLTEFERRWKRIPTIVLEATREAMEKTADAIVADMDRAKPLPEIKIGWTWGDPPKGAMSLGNFGEEGKEASGRSLRITIYAHADKFPPNWFEFGTSPRFHKSGKSTGQITAQPFFYPVWRVWRRRIKGRITRAINRALKSA